MRAGQGREGFTGAGRGGADRAGSPGSPGSPSRALTGAAGALRVAGRPGRSHAARDVARSPLGVGQPQGSQRPLLGCRPGSSGGALPPRVPHRYSAEQPSFASGARPAAGRGSEPGRGRAGVGAEAGGFQRPEFVPGVPGVSPCPAGRGTSVLPASHRAGALTDLGYPAPPQEKGFCVFALFFCLLFVQVNRCKIVLWARERGAGFVRRGQKTYPYTLLP